MLTAYITDNHLDLDRLFGRYPGHTILKTPTRQLSFDQLRYLLPGISHRLQSHIPSGDRMVGVYADDPALYPVLMLACWQADALFVPLDVKTPLDSLLSIVQPDLLITDRAVPPDSATTIIHPDDILVEVSDKKEPAPLNPMDLSAEASVILTSGSSGTPKGVVHTIGNYVYSAWGTIDCLAMTPGDTWLASLPLFHVGGLLIFVRTLLAGALSVLPNSIRDLEESIPEHQPTWLSLVPTQLQRLIDKPEMIPLLRQCRGILLGGAAAPEWLVRKSIQMGIPVLPTYGSTESCAQATGVAPGASEEACLTSGKPLRFRTIRFNDAGNIIIGGKTIFKRYQVDNTTGAGIGDPEFITSDIGRFDSSGNLVVLGRSDQVFQSGGENINPFEIEEAICGLTGVIDAVVVPVNHPEFGQVPWAFIRCKGKLDSEVLRQGLRDKLAAYKIPKAIHEMPVDSRANAIKPDRRQLAHLAAQIRKSSQTGISTPS